MHLVDGRTLAIKAAGLLLLWLGVGAFVYASSTEPRGFLRRLGSAYVANLDTDLGAMFLPRRGSEIAWLQVVLVLVCIAGHALTMQPGFLVGAVFLAALPRGVVSWLVKRRRKKLDAQAHGFALSLSNTLRTTASVGEALRFTAEVSSNPIRQELDLALREMHVGSTAEEALLASAGRARSLAFDVVVSTILIGQKTGGDLPKILEGTASSLRELKRLEEFTDKVTKDSKRAFVLSLVMLTVVIFAVPRFLPHHFDPLFETPKGQTVLIQAVGVFAMAMLMAWRITRKSI